MEVPAPKIGKGHRIMLMICAFVMFALVAFFIASVRWGETSSVFEKTLEEDKSVILHGKSKYPQMEYSSWLYLDSFDEEITLRISVRKVDDPNKIETFFSTEDTNEDINFDLKNNKVYSYDEDNKEVDKKSKSAYVDGDGFVIKFKGRESFKFNLTGKYKAEIKNLSGKKIKLSAQTADR